MRALSLYQPWAWAIFYCGKDIENRSWCTHIRGRILIHAGKRFDYDGAEYIKSSGIILPNAFDMGGVVGSVDLYDCVTKSNSRWFLGKYGFGLKDPISMPFFPCIGGRKFFNIELPLCS